MAQGALAAAIEPLRRSPAATALCFDFDGTLAPIVEDPAGARPLPGIADALAALAVRYGVVAVLSGRPVAFLQQWLPRGVELHGLYGLETVRDGQRHEHPEAEAWRSVIDQVATAGRATVPDGVLVEHKGLSLTLHYRVQFEAEAEVRAFAEAQAARTGLVLRAARKSVELHPPVAVDKGSVLRELARDRAAACFVGDDAGDLAAFDALDDLAGDGMAAVRVAVDSAEAPPELLARADLVVDGPPGVLELLQAL